jgi:hypothetical protein
LKVKFWHFLTARHQSKTQNSIISYLGKDKSYVYFL